MAMFNKATRRKAKLRLALCGTSGSGKTYSALLLAKGLGGRIAMIDTENGSGALYEHLCEYDVAEIKPPFAVEKYISIIHEAEKEGYDVLIIDSLSHAWAGQGGLLEEVDKRAASSRAKNSFAAWREVTPMHNKLVDTILQSRMHIIVTMRTKTAYELKKDSNGKVVPVKMGMAPVQRDGLEYEFTVVLDMDNAKHTANAGKDRTGLFDGKVFVPGEETGQKLLDWLEKGEDIPERLAGSESETPLPQQVGECWITVNGKPLKLSEMSAGQLKWIAESSKNETNKAMAIAYLDELEHQKEQAGSSAAPVIDIATAGLDAANEDLFGGGAI